MNFEKRFPLRDYSDKSKARLLSRNWILSRSQPPIGPLAVCLTSYAKCSVRFWTVTSELCADQSEASTFSSPSGQRTGLSFLPGGGQFEPCLAGVRNLNWKCQVYPVSGAQVFILNIEAFQFEVRSSLSEGHGLEENFKNVHVLKFGRWILT